MIHTIHCRVVCGPDVARFWCSQKNSCVVLETLFLKTMSQLGDSNNVRTQVHCLTLGGMDRYGRMSQAARRRTDDPIRFGSIRPPSSSSSSDNPHSTKTAAI